MEFDISTLAFILIGSFVLAGLLAIVFGIFFSKEDVVEDRLQSFVVEHNLAKKTDEVSMRQVNVKYFSGSLIHRTFIPMIRGI